MTKSTFVKAGLLSVIGVLAIVALVTVVTADCCIEIEWPWCDDIFHAYMPTCEEQCGDIGYFGNCDKNEGYDVYVVPDPVFNDTGYYDYDESEIPALCADVYTCKNTEIECDIQEEPGDWLCETDEFDTFVVTAFFYGVDWGCGEQ